MAIGIVSPRTWFCKRCRDSHDVLYIDTKNNIHYCPKCVPDNIKKETDYFNQNREKVDYKE